MKSFLCTLLFSIFVLAGYAAYIPSDTLKISDPGLDKENCTFNGKPLYGKVQIVDGAANFKVQVTEYIPDLKVLIVEHFPDDCGEWMVVDGGADFTIQFVDGGADFTIRFVEAFPGIP